MSWHYLQGPEEVSSEGSMKHNVLVACEYSGLVRESLRSNDIDAVSCDLLPTEIPGPHIQGDIREILRQDWRCIIAFPPCTDLCVSGARWFAEKRADGRQQAAIDFFMSFVNHRCCLLCVENPVGIMSTNYRKPDQIIQPWQFGHGETKATCLWLRGLPKLKPTNIVDGREHRIHKMPPGETRAIERSRTYQGIAQAMGDQWSQTIKDCLNV